MIVFISMMMTAFRTMCRCRLFRTLSTYSLSVVAFDQFFGLFLYIYRIQNGYIPYDLLNNKLYIV